MSKVTGLLLLLTWVSLSAIHPESEHLEDAEQVEEYLVDLGIPSSNFQVCILSQEESTNYAIKWPNICNLGLDSDNLAASITAQVVSAKAVAHAVGRAKWEPDFLFLIWDDCWSAVPLVVINEYMYALEHPEDYDALAILGSGIGNFSYEVIESQEGDQL